MRIQLHYWGKARGNPTSCYGNGWFEPNFDLGVLRGEGSRVVIEVRFVPPALTYGSPHRQPKPLYKSWEKEDRRSRVENATLEIDSDVARALGERSFARHQ